LNFEFGVRIQNSEITGSGKRRFATRTGTQRAPFRSGESEKGTKKPLELSSQCLIATAASSFSLPYSIRFA
jgi:hypothetical protein